MKWVTFFSQTGSEIADICKKIQRWPDRICTNRSIQDIEFINKDLLENCFDRIYFLPKKPKTTEYMTSLKSISNRDLVTLHGYLRIVPSTVCNMYSMYNGHPGDIVSHPELKGFNPQEKAYKLRIKTTGSVIHSVTSGVDEGPIVMRKPCKINLKSLDDTYSILHKNSVNLWVEFLREVFKIKL